MGQYPSSESGRTSVVRSRSHASSAFLRASSVVPPPAPPAARADLIIRSCMHGCSTCKAIARSPCHVCDQKHYPAVYPGCAASSQTSCESLMRAARWPAVPW